MRKASAPGRQTGRIAGVLTTNTVMRIRTQTTVILAITLTRMSTTIISARASVVGTRTATTAVINMVAMSTARIACLAPYCPKSSASSHFVRRLERVNSRVSDDDIHELAAQIRPIDCVVPQGGVLAMRPLA